jgi:putative two-component system response regulator
MLERPKPNPVPDWPKLTAIDELARQQVTVLVVEDDQVNSAALMQLLNSQGYGAQAASDGETALATINHGAPDLVLLDVQLPGMSGFDVCRHIKQAPATRLIPVVLVTGLDTREHRIAGIDAGADDLLTKPFDVRELNARVKSLLRLKRYTDELDSAESVILSLAMTVEARDAYTEGHCQRLATYAVALGQALGLSDTDLAALHRGGYLHDVGKIGISDALLRKPGKLTLAERAVIEQHPLIGEELCGNLRSLARVRPIVRHHHELRDGSGYPDGLRGDEIPMLAQIVATVDAYDAMTTTRPYRSALSVQYAHAELQRDVVKGLRRHDLVETFIGLSAAGRFCDAIARAIPTPRPRARKAALRMKRHSVSA